MLAIRMQRVGRKGHPTYRLVVQDSRQTPTSGKYVAMIGSYDPHTKKSTLVREKAEFYLSHGAQPSDRVIKLFSSEGVALPNWVKQPTPQSRETRNLEKLRKNRPAEPEPKEEPAAEQIPEETAGTANKTPASETKASEEIANDTPNEASTSEAEVEPKENQVEEPSAESAGKNESGKSPKEKSKETPASNAEKSTEETPASETTEATEESAKEAGAPKDK